MPNNNTSNPDLSPLTYPSPYIRPLLSSPPFLPSPKTPTDCFKVLLTGVACFNLYLQSNYSGPDPGDLLPRIMALRGAGAVEMDDAERSALETDTMNALSVGGELVTPGVFNLSPVPPTEYQPPNS